MKRKFTRAVRFRGFRLIGSFDLDEAVVGRRDWPQPLPLPGGLRRVLPPMKGMSPSSSEIPKSFANETTSFYLIRLVSFGSEFYTVTESTVDFSGGFSVNSRSLQW